MRTIKFRAWDAKQGKFGYIHINPYGICWPDPTWMNFKAGERGVNIEDVESIQQFTGLLDRNGKEIYEGDILNEKSDKRAPGGGHICGTYDFHRENAVLVQWKNGCFVCDHTKPLAHELSWRKHWGGLEIIGNIHENPELIESPEGKEGA